MGAGVLLQNLGQYDEAEKVLRETLAVCKRVLGVEHTDTLETWYSWA